MMRRYGDQMIGLAVLGVDGSPGTVQTSTGAGDQLTLTPAFGVSVIDYPIDSETRRVLDAGRRIVGHLVQRMGGTLIDLTLNPSRSYRETVFSAHPLGTARMSDTPALGVVNADGEVHGYPGLYVADGAAVPTALGVNPSLTIAAPAERVATQLVRRLGGHLAPPPLSNPYVRRRPGEDGAGLPPLPIRRRKRTRRRRQRGRR